MIPRTFPSSVAYNGKTQMIVYFLPSVSGLTRWVDYIPVKLTTASNAVKEDTYDQEGYIPVASISSISGYTPFKEYVPVFLDSSATDADVWDVTVTGFIPVGTTGIGGAALSLDFTATTTLDSRITFTRSTTATRTNASGLIESVAINGARFEYDPVTLAPKGLLIEEQRTNLLTYSDGTVANLGANSGVTTAASAISASFTNSIQFGNNSVSRYAYKSATTTAATAYRLSIYIRMDDDSAPSITTDSLVGDCSLVAEGGVIGTPSVTAVGGNVYRVILAFTGTGVTSNFGVVKYNTQSTKGFRITGYQLEAGAFATSYIPTVASQVTRAADSAVVTGTNFSSWYNQSAGTLYSEIRNTPNGTDRRWMSVFDGTSGFMTARLSAGNLYVDVLQETSGTARSINGATTTSSVVKAANAYALNDVATVLNAGTVYTGATWSPITATSLNIGANVTGFQIINGTIAKIAYYNRRLTNAELQGITT